MSCSLAPFGEKEHTARMTSQLSALRQSYDPEFPIGQLVDHPQNPRRGDDASVDQSVAELGWYGAIIAQRSTSTILAGHTRRRVLSAQGATTAPVVLVDVDDETALRILLADNRTAELAEWDDQELLAVLNDLAETEGGLAGTGFADADLAELLREYGGGDDDLDDALAQQTPSDDPIYVDELVINAALAHYRERGFPYPSLARFESMQRVNQLAALPTELLRTSRVAYHVPDVYHPARFSTKCNDKTSPLATFERDDRLRIAFAMLLEDGRTITDGTLLGMLGWVRGAQAAAQFRPAFALWYTRRFCPDGGRMLDTSSGWGGRLVGFAASGASEYVGIDPSSSAIDGNRRMITDLDIGGATLIQSPAEDVTLDEIGGAASFDFALTSPPYFAKEQYSDEPTQSYLKFADGDAWRDGFLRPTLRLQYEALKPGSTSVVNIADVRIGKTIYPLVEWAIEAAQRVGFTHAATEELPMTRVPGQGVRPEGGEPCLIFTKS